MGTDFKITMDKASFQPLVDAIEICTDLLNFQVAGDTGVDADLAIEASLDCDATIGVSAWPCVRANSFQVSALNILPHSFLLSLHSA